MATSTKSAARKPPRRREAVAPDAIAILKEDHKRVDALFQRFDKLKENGEAKLALVHQICKELTIHAQVEEEIFYPPVRDAIDDDDLMDEADVEHASAKALIAELMQMEPGDDHYDAKVTVLGEYVRHHVKEEQQEMFKKVRSAKVDLKALGASIAARKEELAHEIETSGDVPRRIVAAATA
jgi:hemerythrin superfamily protein